MLSRRGNRLIRRQHSGPPRPDSGHTCRALTVSYQKKTDNQRHTMINIHSFSSYLLPHHVGVSSAGHTLTSVKVEEFVDLWGGQSVSNFQLLDNEHLPGEGLLATGTNTYSSCHRSLPILSYCRRREGFVLKGYLKNTTLGTCWKIGVSGGEL